MTRILLTGGTGQVGWALRTSLAAAGEIWVPGRSELDLGSAEAIAAAVRGFRPQLIVNAAAYTDVDRAETEQPLANAINAQAPGILAQEARRQGAALVHFSTDYVFDGSKPSPYREDDAANPLNAYGRSKLAGEQAVRASGAVNLILRLGWVFSSRRRNFLRAILDRAREQEALEVVTDQLGAPTWAGHVAEAVAHCVGEFIRGASFDAERFAGYAGTYHLTAEGSASRFEFAEAIIECFGLDLRLMPIASSALHAPARRPLNCLLSSDRFRARFGFGLPHWREGLRLCHEELAAGRPIA